MKKYLSKVGDTVPIRAGKEELTHGNLGEQVFVGRSSTNRTLSTMHFIFWAPPIISGKGKATDFKFGGYIYRANPNKSPLKILEKMERGRIQVLPKFFEYALLSQERVKLRT